jgi:hypothetical protein
MKKRKKSPKGRIIKKKSSNLSVHESRHLSKVVNSLFFDIFHNAYINVIYQQVAI